MVKASENNTEHSTWPLEMKNHASKDCCQRLQAKEFFQEHPRSRETHFKFFFFFSKLQKHNHQNSQQNIPNNCELQWITPEAAAEVSLQELNEKTLKEPRNQIIACRPYFLCNIFIHFNFFNFRPRNIQYLHLKNI